MQMPTKLIRSKMLDSNQLKMKIVEDSDNTDEERVYNLDKEWHSLKDK